MNAAPPPCWICGAPERTPCGPWRGHAFLRCPGCGWVQRWPPPSADDLASGFADPSAPPQGRLETQRDGKRVLRQWVLENIEEISPVGRLLDVGCGYGYFLDDARRSGWTARGVEVSRPERLHARKTLGLDVSDKNLEETRFPDSAFDVVTFLEVLEFLPDQESALRETFRVLKPGGWVWIRAYHAGFHLPALRLADAAPFRRMGLKPGILHLHAHTPASLTRALQRTGFEKVSARPSPPTPGDPFSQGGALGSWSVRAAKTAVRTLAGGLHAVTGRTWSSSFLVRARKPDPRPLILHLVTRLDAGGSSENVLLTAERTDPARFASLVASGPPSDPSLPSPRSLLRLPRMRRAVSPWDDWRTLLRLRRLIRTLAPRIVHTHSSKAGFLGRWAARSVPGTRIVHTPHGHIFYGYFPWWKSRFYAYLEKIAAPLADQLVALTEGEKEESLRRGVGRREQWRVAHSGVEGGSLVAGQKRLLRRRVREELLIPESAVVIGTVSRLEPVKGPVELARAAERLLAGEATASPVYLLLIGDGSEKPKLEEVRARLPDPSRLILAGHRTDPLPYMAAMDIYTQPSLNEGMGRAVVMAQAMGLPVVASRVCGLPDVVREGETGLLVPPGDPGALAEALGRLIMDPEGRRKMGEAGREWVDGPVEGMRRFGVERMIALLEHIYDEIL